MTINSNSKRSLTEGYELNGKYMIIKLLSQGELGFVYEAKSLLSGGTVIVKELFPQKVIVIDDRPIVFVRNQSNCIEVMDFSIDDIEVIEELSRIYENEAEIISTLNEFKFSPNFIELVKNNNTTYIVYEYIEGESLQNYVLKDDFNLTDFIKITYRLLEIVNQIHKLGILHGDIKPDNIIVGNDLDIYLCDFGNASYYSKSKEEWSIRKFDRHFKTHDKDQIYMSSLGDDIFWTSKVITYGITELEKNDKITKSDKANLDILRKFSRDFAESALKDNDASLDNSVEIFKVQFKDILSKEKRHNSRKNRYKLAFAIVVLLSFVASYGYYEKKVENNHKSKLDFTAESMIKSEFDPQTIHDEEGKAIFLTENGKTLDVTEENHSISWSDPHNKPFYSFSITNLDTWSIETRAVETWSNTLDVDCLGLADGNYRIYLYATFEDGSFPDYIKYMDFKLAGNGTKVGSKPSISGSYKFVAKGEALKYDWDYSSPKYRVRIMDYGTMSIIRDELIEANQFEIVGDDFNQGIYQFQVQGFSEDGVSGFETADFRVVSDKESKGTIIKNEFATVFRVDQPMIINLEQSPFDSNTSIRIYSINEGIYSNIDIASNITEFDISQYANKGGVYIVYIISDNNKKKAVNNYINVYVIQ